MTGDDDRCNNYSASGIVDIDGQRRFAKGGECTHRSWRSTRRYSGRSTSISGSPSIEIGRELGCGASTVSRRLRRFGVSVRRRGPDPERNRASRHARTDPVAVRPRLDRRTHRSGWEPLAEAEPDSGRLQRRRIAGRGPSPPRFRTSIRRHVGGWGQRGYHITWNDRTLYEWLIDIGL